MATLVGAYVRENDGATTNAEDALLLETGRLAAD
jgi:hypothetical protein